MGCLSYSCWSNRIVFTSGLFWIGEWLLTDGISEGERPKSGCNKCGRYARHKHSVNRGRESICEDCWNAGFRGQDVQITITCKKEDWNALEPILEYMFHNGTLSNRSIKTSGSYIDDMQEAMSKEVKE